MNLFIRTLIAMAATLSPALAADSTAEIRGVISSYQQALNDNDADGVARLFTEDGVVMIQNAPTNAGNASVRAFYGTLFKTLDLDIRFRVAEVMQVSATWAFVRTDSSGTVRVLANGSNGASAGHELFVLEKTGTHWKIARYAASSAK